MAISQPTVSNNYQMYQAGSPDAPSTALTLVASLVFTAAGFTNPAAGDISLIRLPAGRWSISLDLSRIVCPAGTVNSDLDIGIGAYRKLSTGANQSLVGNALADSLDVGGGALNQSLGTGAVMVDPFTGADIVCSFDTANSPASGLMVLTLVFRPA